MKISKITDPALQNAFLKRRTLTVLLFILLSVSINAREIILDSIYIRQPSSVYSSLINLKLELYKIIQAVPVDDNVIFAGWKDGNNLIYIKEFRDSGINYIYLYESNFRRNTKLAQINGAVTCADMNSAGNRLLIKTITFSQNETKSNFIIFDINKNSRTTSVSNSYFSDFTFSPDGNSLIRHTSAGITEMKFSSGKEKTLIPVNLYSSYIQPDGLTNAFISPDGERTAVITGGGGSYKCLLFKNRTLDYILTDVTSASEFFWINSSEFVYRSGYSAFYKAGIFNTVTRKKRDLGPASLNTNITYSPSAGMISFLKESLVNIYSTGNKKLISLPLEGEDIRFAPDRNRFCILFNNSLFIVKKSVIESKMFFLKRKSAEIADIYTKALNEADVHENDFSKQFIIRKLSVYSGFTKK
ncbi:MAG: hypothetical protein JW982_02070 [Spirochaetes bacterium]|nr:hypothetical protein [Spirochaetota bacterium]